jgi:DNA polymerase-4
VACLRRIVDQLEPAGFGAAYLDARERGQAPEPLALHLVATVRADLRLPLRVGIAPSKVLARLAAESVAGEGLRRVRGDEVAGFLAPLPIARLPRVGRKTETRLQALGVRTVAELLALGRTAVEAALGHHGLAIFELAAGLDRSPVRVAAHPQTISRERTLDGSGTGALSEGLRGLATLLERELVRQGLGARRVALRARLQDQSATTRSVTLGAPVSSAAEIAEVAGGLAARLDVTREAVRALALTVAGLVSAGDSDRQLELFAPEEG